MTEAREYGHLRALDGPFPIDIAEYITHARRDPDLLNGAAKIWGEETASLFAVKPDRERTLRISQAGSCGRALWAEFRGMSDEVDDLKTLISRFDGGHLFGSWEAALLSVAIEERHPGYRCGREKETEFHGVTGHMDLHVYEETTGRTVWVVDFKMSWTTRAVNHTHTRSTKNMLQVASYAHAERCNVFSLFTMAPSAAKNWYRQSDYELTSELYAEAYHDSLRLRKAVSSETMPEGDPVESWQCNYCRFQLCDRNPNMPEVF